MNVYRRFFKVNSGEFLKVSEAASKTNEIAKKKYKSFLKRIGAEEQFYIRDSRMVGIIFTNNPDRYLYKEVKYGWWWPKKNTRQGKALNRELMAIKTVPEQSLLKTVGLSPRPTLFNSSEYHISTLITIPSEPLTLLISTPWYDEDPKKVLQYIEDKKKNNNSTRSSNLEVLLWEPPKELVEIKEWQYQKEISDWNESLEGKE